MKWGHDRRLILVTMLIVVDGRVYMYWILGVHLIVVYLSF